MDETTQAQNTTAGIIAGETAESSRSKIRRAARRCWWWLHYKVFRPYRPTGFMCRVDFEYELGMASGGSCIYPCIEDIREHRKCVDGCGIVEVEVRLKRVVQEGIDPEE